jgi:octaprenyl-diphosphate synthase
MELRELYEPIREELTLVEREIRRQIDAIVSAQYPKNRRFMKRIVHYLFEIPGKLLRPALVLLSAKAVDGDRIVDTEQLIKLATAVEFVHSASLIHDDIIDDSDYRRNQITLNKQYGNQIAVLVGDIFYSQFFSILIDLKPEHRDQREKLLMSFSDTTRKLCFGEIYEHKIRIRGEEASMDEYLRVVEDKTASLFSVSCMSGALLNGADEDTCLALSQYGLNLGYTFQIVDDHIDRDAIFDSHEGIMDSAYEYADTAKKALEILPEKKVKRILLSLPDLIMARAGFQ